MTTFSDEYLAARAVATVAYDGQTCGGKGDSRIRKEVVEKRSNVIMFVRGRNSGKTDVPDALARLQERWA